MAESAPKVTTVNIEVPLAFNAKDTYMFRPATRGKDLPPLQATKSQSQIEMDSLLVDMIQNASFSAQALGPPQKPVLDSVHSPSFQSGKQFGTERRRSFSAMTLKVSPTCQPDSRPAWKFVGAANWGKDLDMFKFNRNL